MATSQGKQAQEKITSWANKEGEFKRLPSTFRSHIEKGGQFPPEKGRYMLYVSYACPWAHRALIVRQLKGLGDFVDVSVVHPHMGAMGWSFYPPIRGEDGEYPATTGETGPDDGIGGVIPDPLYGAKFARDLYFRAEKTYEGRFTVPILWDKKAETIVNNESSEIIRMFNTEFNSELPSNFAALDLYPTALRDDIEAQNSWVYDTVNNGVYKSGFATSAKAYEANVHPLFESLEKLEKILEGGKKFVVGDVMTEADVRLFTTITYLTSNATLVPSATTYVQSLRNFVSKLTPMPFPRFPQFPNLNHWQKNLYYNYPAFKDTTNFEHIKHHYFTSHPQINPTRIVIDLFPSRQPVGPLPAIEPL